MAGGLIQIATYGSQDLYLTGTPEITFFKVVYRRHTNFATESIRVPFDDPVSFGNMSCVTVPKIADLIHKTYLEIRIPEVNLKRFTQPDTSDLIINKNNAESYLQVITDFMGVNRRAFVAGFDLFIAENSNSTSDMIQAVQAIFLEPTSIPKVDAYRDLLNTQLSPYAFNETSLDSIVSIFDISDPKEDLFKEMGVAINKSIKVQEKFYKELLVAEEALADGQNTNIKFAWVERLGHSIIDNIDVKIGGYRIDKHLGDWINIWYELTANRDLESTYFKLIGNVPELITFDRSIKPAYLIRVPLQFWFCRFSGLALPLVSLEYHELTFHVRFRKFDQLSYIEAGNTIKFKDFDSGLFLDEISEQVGLNIEATLLIDYIYLDGPERRRFAQASHEYLIEQIQYIELTDINQPNILINLNNFVHPSKELVWVSQKNKYTENIDGTTPTRFNNYSLTDSNIGNPIQSSRLDFHSYIRVPQFDDKYFNYVQPYETHNTTPSDGINMYAFARFPEEHQPSSAANLSHLSRISLSLAFNPTLFTEEQVSMNIRIYTRNINILRFISGMAGLAYVYG